MAYCEKCGEKNPDGAKFCSACRSPLHPVATEQVRLAEKNEDQQLGVPPKWKRKQPQQTDNDGSKCNQQKRPVDNSSRVSKIRRGCLKLTGIYLGLSLYGALWIALGWFLCAQFRGCEETPAESETKDSVKVVTTTTDNLIEVIAPDD